MAELKPCPFAHDGLAAHRLSEAAEIVSWNEDDGEGELCFVECCGCGAQGPYCDTEELAAAAWNRRAVPPEERALVEAAREIAASGISLRAEPPGLAYHVVQVDAETWDALRAALAAYSKEGA